MKTTLVLVSHAWNGKNSLKIKGLFPNKPAAQKELRRLQEHADKIGYMPDYRLLSQPELDKLKAKIVSEGRARQWAGAKKAAETRKKEGVKPHFVLCPTCKSKSKMLYSEMGGLQTRVCKRGHRFTYDKWIADRAFWNPAAILSVYEKLS